MAYSKFQKERHIKYFLRCLKTVLPHQYTTGDSNRVLLAFFTVAGLDLLGVLQTSTTPEERQGYIDWLYHCQLPSGGFRGFTGTIFGDQKRTRENEAWDPANLPATFLALETLLILGDDLSRVKRQECLQWLPKMQREDGSFGEVLGVNEEIEGGRDLRFCYCAAGIRYLLRGKHDDDLADVKDIDVEKLISFIESCQTYDGGMAEAPFCEAHAGLTYCAVGALSFLKWTSEAVRRINVLSPDTQEFASLLKWLVSRQTTELEAEEEDDDNDKDEDQDGADSVKPDPSQHAEGGVEAPSLNDTIQMLPDISPPTEGSLTWAGFNGRCNKIADTCYCFWATGALAMLDRLSLIDASGNRLYLLDKTQHLIGGFGKGVGEPPDLLHSYLGLVSLALLNEPGLDSADPTLCAGTRILDRVKSLPWWREDTQPDTCSKTSEGKIDYLMLANSYNELLQEFSSKDLRNVGNYSLGRLIGKGSFGKVYLGTHKLTNGSKVVLKSSNKEDANLAREIHHHRQFLHPHIARLYEVIVTENLVWLVLEYCPGDELYNYLLNHGPLPVEKVRRIFSQLVGAVAYVHSKSCVHRDLKLENILLDKNENVKLCDFGFTREYEGKASYLQTFCGTICYSAPEMLKGEKYAGEKVDVWSLGIILYALLAGELPFDEDDEQETKRKILTEEPKFNERFPEDARQLISVLLSKRPLLRPTLDEILAHPFLGEYGAEQKAILERPRPSPFTTPLEKTTLLRMKSAGVNIDQVIENVLAQRCDALAGWWALLIEKEERKERRRERKRKEREAEAKSLRRLSAASSKRLSTALAEVNEEGTTADTLQTRGRRDRRSLPNAQLSIPEVPKLPESVAVHTPDSTVPPPPIDKDSIRSVSSTRQRPVPPPKENRRSRPSMLHVSASQPELGSHSNGIFKRRGRRHHHPIISQLASLKHWLVESAKRAKSPHPKTPKSTSEKSLKFRLDKSSPEKGDDSGKKQAGTSSTAADAIRIPTPTDLKRASNASSLAPSSASYPNHRNSLPRQPRALNTNTSNHRNSLSPSPITPRSSYRRSSVGLRGRKSTSSSVSSIRSIHHAHTHSKASSASSNSLDTVSTPTASTRISKSPHASVKVLPTTPSASSRFPSNIRLVRNPPNSLRDPNAGIYSVFNETAPAPLMSSPASGLVFARRKRTAFKGPMLHTANLMISGGLGTPGLGPDLQAGEEASTRPRTRKSQIIMEEEDDVEDEDIEEVDAFSSPEVLETSFNEVDKALDEPAGQDKHGQEQAVAVESEDHKHVLAPAPDLSPINVRPPLSPSLTEAELQSPGIDETESKADDATDSSTLHAETAAVDENEEHAGVS
ncbi:hypothetical protein VTN77DRAFT_5307 [Rasamsonia byssochlamydoides]|uniref:uncharacterized protein n=1 Tax=Rasamsonia byssochlamydoides TaxID=89139 RepID=UPI0037434DA1